MKDVQRTSWLRILSVPRNTQQNRKANEVVWGNKPCEALELVREMEYWGKSEKINNFMVRK